MVEISLGGGLAALIIGIILAVIARVVEIEPWVNKLLYALGIILIIIGIILLILFFVLPIV
jgi:uncharacterized membrane protein